MASLRFALRTVAGRCLVALLSAMPIATTWHYGGPLPIATVTITEAEFDAIRDPSAHVNLRLHDIHPGTGHKIEFFEVPSFHVGH
jgi:hypothetical protein